MRECGADGSLATVKVVEDSGPAIGVPCGGAGRLNHFGTSGDPPVALASKGTLEMIRSGGVGLPIWRLQCVDDV